MGSNAFRYSQRLNEKVTRVLNINSTEYRRIEIAIDAELTNVFNHNASFFKRIRHPYFSKFVDYQPKRLKLRLSENGYVNLYNIKTGKEVYPEDPVIYAEKQAAVYLKERTHYVITESIVDEGHEDYPHTEYITKTNEKYNQLVPKLIEGDETLAEQLFMFGAGLCLQLQYVLNALDVKNLILFEPDDDALYFSMFVVDWEAILSYFRRDGYNFHIFNVDSSDINLNIVRSILHKKGQHRCSKLDYYFHYDNDELRDLGNNLSHYLTNILGSSGYFEDERLGFAHSLENVMNNIPFLNKHMAEHEIHCNKPVLIVGNGPSLDQLEEFLTTRSEQFIIISCGTSLSTLLKKGITPDIHIEQERVKLVLDVVSETSIKNVRDEIFFIGLNPCHPGVFSLFTNKHMVFKANDLATDYFKDHGNQDLYALYECNPLVANFGLSLALMLGFKEIYLAGVDCGMKNIDEHHSKDSFYYSHSYDVSEYYANKKMRLVKGNFTDKIITNPVFNNSRIALEALLKKFTPECYNLSDGAYISGAEPMQCAEVKPHPVIENKKTVIKKLLDNCASSEKISTRDIDKEIHIIKQYFESICFEIQANFVVSECSYEEMASKFDNNEQLLKKSKSECVSAYRLLYGSIRGMMINITAAKKVMSDDDFSKFIVFAEAEQLKFFAAIRRQVNDTLLNYL